MSQNQSPTSGPAPTPITPPPSRRANRPPRINIHNLNSGSAMSQASMPPSAQPPFTSQTNYTSNGTQGPYWPPVANPFGYDNFMTKGYEGFLDLTKTGMSFGEKFTYGLYNKFSKLSRRWFTHMFLIIVLGLYNVAGALIFKAIEYRKEAAEIAQLHNDRIAFFNKILNLAKDPALNSTLFPGKMVDIMNDYSPVIDSVMRNGLVDKQNPWTFFNAMVYSSTIYTTIGE